jgi:hypothetical protein
MPTSTRPLAEEILRYLRRHPGAQDTLAGIARWWIARQRIHELTERVRAAMNVLTARKLVEMVEMPDGTVLYRAGRGKSARVHAPAGAQAATGLRPRRAKRRLRDGHE